jgi:hypothetical protein
LSEQYTASVHAPGRAGDELELGTFTYAGGLFDYKTQPRDAKGRFSAVAGAKATVAAHVAKHLVETGIAGAKAEGATVHLPGGGKIEIGNRGDRSYHGTTGKLQHLVESHLTSHQEKHVRDWASKTTPAPPVRKPRQVSPEKQAKRDKARQEKQAAKETRRKARQEQKAERQKAEAERKQRHEARQKAREQVRAEKVAALQAIGAPMTDKGEIDATRVPGATSTFKPPTTADPASGFRGRSFYARSAEEMKQEFLDAAGKAGANHYLIERVVGGTTKHAGGARDKAQWDAVRLKYDAPNVETFDEAFRVLARAAAEQSPTRRPDWRNFDLETLRECSGLEQLEIPGWLHDAANHQEMLQQAESYYQSYGESAELEHQVDEDEDQPRDELPADDLADLPF